MRPLPFTRQVGIPQKQRTRAYHLSAPVGGINTVSPASRMEAGDCLYLYNLIPFQYGLRVRSGWHEFATNVGDAPAVPDLYQDSSPLMMNLAATLGGARIGAWTGITNPGVRSILSFAGSSSRGLTDRLFACTSEGIWDITKGGDAPTLAYTFPVANLTSGRGVGTSFTNLAGEHFYAYCDETNGYILYRESTDSWVKITEGSGTDGLTIKGANPASFRFVMPWKNRLWFVGANSSVAYYLPVNQFAGIIEIGRAHA